MATFLQMCKGYVVDHGHVWALPQFMPVHVTALDPNLPCEHCLWKRKLCLLCCSLPWSFSLLVFPFCHGVSYVNRCIVLFVFVMEQTRNTWSKQDNVVCFCSCPFRLIVWRGSVWCCFSFNTGAQQDTAGRNRQNPEAKWEAYSQRTHWLVAPHTKLTVLIYILCKNIT